jgi:hypothetical protein
MTKEDYHKGERDYSKYGWVLVLQVLAVFVFLGIVINHLKK